MPTPSSSSPQPDPVRPASPAVRPTSGGIPAGLLWLLGIALLMGAAVVFAVRPWSKPPDPLPEVDPFLVTPVSPSPYLNTTPEVQYVGSEACRECHADRHASFRRTGMGRSMAAVDPAREPADVTYDHPLSKRRYQVVRKDGAMWHREFLLAPGVAGVLLAEHPVTYVVGSGRHSLTYVCEPDGFMTESPVTWYTSKGAWAMSPGYDRANQRGFEREVGTECLICHAGRVEPVDGTLHKMKVIEAAIGCERCHGPGALHAERHRGRPRGEGPREPDMTIVNPRELSRELAEAVCQQCHLRPTSATVARGRDMTMFRPGLPLQDFLHTFQSRAENARMSVVGHVEQLHLSKCYKGSSTLTCVTCHDPHAEPRAEDRVGYYRSVCQQCHAPTACKVSPTRLAKESPANDCVQCHMPRSPTDIPHLAFSHHRIGLHDKSSAVPAAASDDLDPFLDLSRFSDAERQRSLGLAYLEAANREKDFAAGNRYRSRALDVLQSVRAAGLRDPAVEANLARIIFSQAPEGEVPPEVQPYAEAALAFPDIGGQDRCMALYLKAAGLAAQGRHADALGSIRELTRIRRHPADWLLVAECEQALGHDKAWVEALEMVVRIDPRHWKEQRILADVYAARGDKERANYHRARAVP